MSAKKTVNDAIFKFSFKVFRVLMMTINNKTMTEANALVFQLLCYRLSRGHFYLWINKLLYGPVFLLATCSQVSTNADSAVGGKL